MAAPDLQTLFDVESQVESNLQTILDNQLTVDDVSVRKQRDNTNLDTPRVSVQLTLGAVTGHLKAKTPADTRNFYDAWNAQLAIGIVTERTINDAAHALLRAQVRLFMQYGYALLGNDALPYHTITKISEAGTSIGTDPEKAYDLSTVRFACVISIRNSAWPAVA